MPFGRLVGPDSDPLAPAPERRTRERRPSECQKLDVALHVYSELVTDQANVW